MKIPFINRLSGSEFNTLVKLSKKILWADTETRKKIQSHNVNIVPANFYSNIPTIDDIKNSFEYRGDKLDWYDQVFDKEKIEQFIDVITPYAEEFSPPLKGNRENPAEFFWENPAFSFSDAMSYYCMIRHFKPDNILEIGAGFSTLVADCALKKNGSGRLTLIEPYPKAFLGQIDSVDTIIESFVQDIPLAELIEMIEGVDLWFIDSTHTVKVGSDCLYLYLNVMPRIATELIVHSHDIFLPYGFPKEHVMEQHIYWTEQYLLYAYMLDNPKVDVLFGSTYASRQLPESSQRLMGGKCRDGGGSIWYRLNRKLSGD